MDTENAVSGTAAQKNSIFDSSFPVLLPYDETLFLPEDEFQAIVCKTVSDSRKPHLRELEDEIAEIDSKREDSSLKRRAEEDSEDGPAKKSIFIRALEKHGAHFRTHEDLEADNKTLTDNADVTNISSANPLVDLFYDLGENTSPERLKTLLRLAWDEDSLMTLKIIFNARSIHLGKSNRNAAYKALGWMAEHHPLTLLQNLRWLVRPVIQKKVPKADAKGENKGPGAASKQHAIAEDEDFDMIGSHEAVIDSIKAYDVQFGVSHGYWKDLLNLLVFAANDQLQFDSNPSLILSPKKHKGKEPKKLREWDQGKAKELRQRKKKEQHARVVEKLQNNAFYRALHNTVARLFAEQLRHDGDALQSGEKADLKKLSLAAKWAPTFGEFHDKHTFVLSSIAEILYPNAAEVCPDSSNRELYLRYAREACRKTYTSPLRKALAVVEREIAAKQFDQIDYEKVPSLAMERYTPLFMKKDFENFSAYVKKVAQGNATISGATLIPSTLIKKVRGSYSGSTGISGASYVAVKASAEAQISRQIIDSQWRTLVKRVKESGTLDSSIAICDVSGSMNSPRLADGTTPMDSSIGLSLLVSEVTKSPFGGGFITFSQTPHYVSVGGPADSRDLVEKTKHIESSTWAMNTNFVAVFEDVILPMAVSNKLKQEDMVKQVFVFSDMQFDHAEDHSEKWTTSYERIKGRYAAAGYEMPKLIFWNLASSTTSKPVTMEDQNTALVSGYSQGMLKVFLDSGDFEEDETEVVEEVLKDEDGMTQIKVTKKMNPLTVVKKAVSHKAYAMLEVVD